MQPEDIFIPGPALERIASGYGAHGKDSHAYRKHPDARQLTPAQYAAKVRSEVLNADRAVAVRQGKADESILFVNGDHAGWVNLAKPSRSTYFKPRGGAEQYLERRAKHFKNTNQPVRNIDLPTVRRLDGRTSPARIGKTAVAAKAAANPDGRKPAGRLAPPPGSRPQRPGRPHAQQAARPSPAKPTATTNPTKPPGCDSWNVAIDRARALAGAASCIAGS